MNAIASIASKQDEPVFCLLLDLLYSMKHRCGQNKIVILTDKGEAKADSLKEMQEKSIEGSKGIAFSYSNESKATILDGALLNQEELPMPNAENLREFVSKANGGYAIALNETDSFLAFRDFLGLKPIWFGSNPRFNAFASEPNALKKLNITFPEPLPPGHAVQLNEKAISAQKIFDLNDFLKTVPAKTSFEQLLDSFNESISLSTSGLKRAGVLFSGGVDSSAIAKAVSEKVKNVSLYTVGMQGSPDVKEAEKTSQELGLKLHLRIVEKSELKDFALAALKTLCFFDEMQLTIAVPEFIACAEAKKHGEKILFSGQGSDELFCGYSSFKQTLAEKGLKGVETEIHSMLQQMWSRNFYRDEAIASRHFLDLSAPFLERGFLRSALAFPAKEKILSPKDELRKHPIRKIAQALGLSSAAYLRQKKAIQYGSGIGKEIVKLF
ncbi:MAG: asparagine synthase-related protein [Candidatus Diapherotrites archaeon]